MAMAGTVKFFNAERGYGFIKPDDGGRDVFVHVTAVERAGLKSLNEGQRISFDVEPDKKGKGPKAVNLVITGGGPSRRALRGRRPTCRCNCRRLSAPRQSRPSIVRSRHTGCHVDTAQFSGFALRSQDQDRRQRARPRS